MLCDVKKTGGGFQLQKKKKRAERRRRCKSTAAADCKAGSARREGERSCRGGRPAGSKYTQQAVVLRENDNGRLTCLQEKKKRKRERKKDLVVRAAEFGKDCEGVTAETTQKWNREINKTQTEEAKEGCR